jgi:hypothetical protein
MPIHDVQPDVAYHDHDAPDFIERNGTWVLSMVGVLSACLGTIFAYFLRSRCKTIRCCGVVCERQPVELTAAEIRAVGEG